MERHIQVEYVFQELHKLPEEYAVLLFFKYNETGLFLFGQLNFLFVQSEKFVF